jgi:putative transcriptional regulator
LSTRTRLVKFRNNAGLSHEDIARLAGISRSHYTLIENGKRSPSLDVALRIANIVGCNVEDIFFGHKCRTAQHP